MAAAARTGLASAEEWQQVVQARQSAETLRSQLDQWQTTVALLAQKLQLQLAQNEVLAQENAALRMEAEAEGAGPALVTPPGGSSATQDAEFAARFEHISASLQGAVSEQVATPDESPLRPMQPSPGVPSSVAMPRQAAPAAMASSMSTEHGVPELPTPQAAVAAAVDTWTGPEVPYWALQAPAPKSSSLEKRVPAEKSVAPSREPLQMSFGGCDHANAGPCMAPRAAAGTVARALPLPPYASPTPDASDSQEGATWRRHGAATVGNKCNKPQHGVELAEEHTPACVVDAFLQGLGSRAPRTWDGSAAPQNMALAKHPKELATQQASPVKIPSRTLGSKRPLRPLNPDVTTLAVRNIPARYSQQQLLGEWPPDGTYDLLHLPYNAREKKTFGYAFINFASHDLALEFQQRWHGKFLSEHGRTRALDIASASIQGYWLNLQRLLGRSIDGTADRDRLPATFSGMTRLDTQQELQKLACLQ